MLVRSSTAPLATVKTPPVLSPPTIELSGPEICNVPLCTSIVPPSLLKFRGDMIAVPAPALLRSVPRLMKVSMATSLIPLEVVNRTGQVGDSAEAGVDQVAGGSCVNDGAGVEEVAGEPLQSGVGKGKRARVGQPGRAAVDRGRRSTSSSPPK